MNLTYTHGGAGYVKTISGVTRTPLSPRVTDYTHTANKLNDSTGKVAKTYTHDDAGNIISDGTRTFVYNQNSRLVQVTEGSSVIAEYAYDGFGRRVKKTVGSEIVHYHYDLAGQLICETDGSGSSIRNYIYLNGEPVAMQLYGDDAGWYYYVNDHLGTPQKVVDASGSLVWEAGYLPFGEARLLVADIDNNLRFPGQYYDAETGLHYNWHRYYDPESGRYWSVDPIGLDGGINLYMYVSGNPVNFFDLYGLTETIRNAPGLSWRILDSVYTRAHQLAHPEQWGPGQGVDNLMFLADIASIGLGIGAEKAGMNCLSKIAEKSGRRTWQKAGMSAADAKRIQNAANRTKQKITVVGSRAKGNSKATSDWDYIMSGKSSQRHSAKSSVPRGTQGGEINSMGRETGIDVFQNYNPHAPSYSPLNTNQPHVVFNPN